LRSEYREEYVPGTENSPGYVRSWADTIEYPCSRTNITRTPENTTRTRRYEEYDENDCSSCIFWSSGYISSTARIFNGICP
jgi:hypothetical protein